MPVTGRVVTGAIVRPLEVIVIDIVVIVTRRPAEISKVVRTFRGLTANVIVIADVGVFRRLRLVTPREEAHEGAFRCVRGWFLCREAGEVLEIVRTAGRGQGEIIEEGKPGGGCRFLGRNGTRSVVRILGGIVR